MHILSFYANGFRNLKSVQLFPHPGLNIIFGGNAQGKTNLLDAIYMMTGCRNFHGAKQRHYLGFDAEFFQCGMHFFDGRREQKISYCIRRSEPKKKYIRINGVETSQTAGLFENFHCVAFSPCDVDLISGIPEKRRAFMDLCACQLRPSGMEYVSRAAKLLAQRNAGIQSVHKGGFRRQDVPVWDAQLAIAGSAVSCMRASYVRSIAPLCQELYSILTGGKETFSVVYKSAIYGSQELPETTTPELTARYREVLNENLDEDLRVGYTRKGIQRDEMLLHIDGWPVHLFGSQGQKKSAALVLKLAQAHLYYAKTRRSPVILLDDVMGELDERRQKLIYDMVSRMQVFMTLCQPSSLQITQEAKVFVMREGRLETS